MKYITEKEFEELDLAYSGGRNHTKWFHIFKDIPVGQALIVYKHEWEGKHLFKDMVNRFKHVKHHPLNLKCHQLADRSGWVVRRMK